MIINLYSVRIILRALGEDDYGLYQVVAGVVISIQSFSSVIHTSTLRFYSYSIGNKTFSKLSEIFSASINIYIGIGLLCIVLGETIGFWFINNKLIIPPDRVFASNWIYQFAVFSLIITLFQAPYSSIVIAYEEMAYFAIVSLSESILKLLAIIAISFSSKDKLILYGLSLMIVPLISLFAYRWKSKKSFPHIKYCKVKRKKWYNEMLSFSGWHLFSAGASVGINQVNTILINLFFPLIINAARGVSLQVMNAFNAFTSSIIIAVRPPLIKAYAEKNYQYLNQLFNYSNKFIFYMILIIAIPIIFEMKVIIELWLGESSEYMILFSRLIVIYSIILALNNPISIIIQATGKIRQYFIPVECVTMTCPLITYWLFKTGFPPQATFYTMIVTIAIAHVVRVYCLKLYYPQFELRKYLLGFIIPAFAITILLILILLPLYYTNYLPPFIFITLSFFIVIPVIYYLGFTRSEKDRIKNLLEALTKKRL